VAVIFNNKKTKDKEQEAAPLGQPQIINPGTAAPISASSSPGAPATPAPGAGTSSGSFTNLKSYIDANKNFNKDGGGLAGKVVSNLTNQGDKVKSDVQGATAAFNTQKDAQVGQMQQGAGLVQQAVVDPNAFVQNQQNVDSLATARDAAYTGPRSLADLEGQQNQGVLQARADNFSTSVDQGKTEKGRFNLLRNMFGRPSYTSGQQNLDNLLIQGQKDQIQKINNTGRLASDVNRTLAQGSDAAAQSGSQAVLDAQGIRQQTRQALNDRVSAENATIQTQLQAAQDQQNRALYSAAKGLKSGVISEADAARFGINSGERTFGTNLASLLRRGEDPTQLNTASAENFAQMAALNKLLGGGDALSEESSKIIPQFSDASQAGKFDPNSYGFDKNSLSINSQSAQSQYNSAIDRELQNYIKNINANNPGWDSSGADDVKELMRLVKSDRNKSVRDQLIAANRKFGNWQGTDDEVIKQIASGKNNASKKLLDAAAAAERKYGVNDKIKVQGDGAASIDDYNQQDAYGDSRGEALLRSLGLLK